MFAQEMNGKTLHPPQVDFGMAQQDSLSACEFWAFRVSGRGAEVRAKLELALGGRGKHSELKHNNPVPGKKLQAPPEENGGGGEEEAREDA